MRTAVKVRKRYIVTIPEEIREVMNIREGDILEIDIQKISKGD